MIRHIFTAVFQGRRMRDFVSTSSQNWKSDLFRILAGHRPSSALPIHVLDFRPLDSFWNQNASMSTRVENRGQILNFSPTVKLGDEKSEWIFQVQPGTQPLVYFRGAAALAQRFSQDFNLNAVSAPSTGWIWLKWILANPLPSQSSLAPAYQISTQLGNLFARKIASLPEISVAILRGSFHK